MEKIEQIKYEVYIPPYTVTRMLTVRVGFMKDFMTVHLHGF